MPGAMSTALLDPFPLRLAEQSEHPPCLVSAPCTPLPCLLTGAYSRWSPSSAPWQPPSFTSGGDTIMELAIKVANGDRRAATAFSVRLARCGQTRLRRPPEAGWCLIGLAPT